MLNWNGLSFLNACLSALTKLDYPSYNILLVDNNSADGSIEFVRRQFPQVNIMQNHQNLGYAGGNNRALRNLNADYSVLINPDIVIDSGWLAELITVMHADDSIGIAGGKLHYPDGQTIQHAGGYITHPRGVPSHRGIHEKDTGQYETVSEVEYVTGAALAIKRSVLEKIGLLDEGFFMYFEEVDWCARARATGYRIMYIPQATAVHDESAIAVKGSKTYLQRFHAGRWRYLLKHFNLSEILSETIAAEEKWLRNCQTAERRALKYAYRHVHQELDEILAARVANGGTSVADSQRTELESSLVHLRKCTTVPMVDQTRLDQLSNLAQIQKMTFSSRIPLVGVLIARLRTLWGSIAAREQAKPIAIQQSDFNQSLVNKLQEMTLRLEQIEFDLLEHDERQIDIKHQQTEVRAELDHAYELLESIRSRLTRLEKPENDN